MSGSEAGDRPDGQLGSDVSCQAGEGTLQDVNYSSTAGASKMR